MVTRSFTEFYGVQRNKEPQRTKRELKRHADQRRVGKVMSLTRIASSVISGVRHRVWQVRVGPARRWKASTAAAENLEGPEPPNGFLFNEKPLLPGEKRQKGEWENSYLYGMAFNFLLVIAICTLKPDTSVSAWAKQKAIERLAEKDAARAEASSRDSEE